VADKKIHLKNLKKSYVGRTVVNVDDMTLGTHGIEGLIGPNGAGKTTLMNLITNKISSDHGEVVFYPEEGGEIDISKYPMENIARLGIVRTNQIIQDFESLTIRESMLLAYAHSKHEGLFKLFSDKTLREEAEASIKEYFDYFHFENPDGHALSAGEKKLLDIIRCLILKPTYLLMDEPTAGLPEDETNMVMELMKKKTAEEQISILIVEHDLDLIWNVSELVYFMAEGQIMLKGTPEYIREHQTVAAKYMGEEHV